MQEEKEIAEKSKGIGIGIGMVIAAILFQVAAELSQYGYCDLDRALLLMTEGLIVAGVVCMAIFAYMYQN